MSQFSVKLRKAIDLFTQVEKDCIKDGEGMEGVTLAQIENVLGFFADQVDNYIEGGII